MADSAEKELEEMLASGMTLDEINKELDLALAQRQVRPPMAGPQPGPWAEGYRRPEANVADAKARPMGAPSRPDPAPMKPPTLGQRMAAALDPMEMAKSLKKTVGSVGVGFNRAISGGAIPALMDRLGLDSPEHRAQYDSTAGRVVGETLGMAPLVAAGGGVASALAQKGAAAAPGLVSRVGTAALDTAIPEALTSTIEGNDAGETMKRAGVAGAVGAALPAAGEGLRMTGKTLEFLDPWVGRYQRAKDKGVYGRPDQKTLKGGDEGIQKASEIGRDRILARDLELNAEAGKAYDEAVDPLMSEPGDPSAMHEALLEMARQNSTTAGTPLRGGKVHDRIKAVSSEVGLEPTVGDLLKVRRSLKNSGAPDSLNPTDDQSINRELYGAVKDSLKETAPADAAYAKAMDRSRRTTDILAGKEGKVVDTAGEGRVAVEQRMADTVSKVHDTTRTGLKYREHLEELAAQDPEFAAALDFVANKKAKEAVGFSKFSDALKFAGVGPLLSQNARALLSTGVTAAKGTGKALGTAGKIARPALAIDPMDEAMEKFRKRQKKEKK